jgi:carbamate kinase
VRVVAALGGNALLQRGEPPESDIQEAHVVKAVEALAPLARDHDLVITHGNGPQVGLLALESAHDLALSHPYPFDVLGAQTQGMIGYWLVQALQNALPRSTAACVISRTLVHADDPAFANPTKFVGPVYDAVQASKIAADYGWEIRKDGDRMAPSCPFT